MDRPWLAASLLVVIAVSGAFVYLRLGALGYGGVFFDNQVRWRAAANPGLRRLLGLGFDGDAAADYLGRRHDSIWIEVDAMAGQAVDYRALNRFAEAVAAVTEKPATLLVFETGLPAGPAGQDRLSELARRHANAVIPRSAASLYVLLAESGDAGRKELGTTVGSGGLAVFKEALRDFAGSAGTAADYEFSTLLHEFGHQLGLPHNDLPGCLMNEKAETGGLARHDSGQVVSDFCDAEKEQIKAASARLR